MLVFWSPRRWLHALILVAAVSVVSAGASAQSSDDLTALNRQVADLMKARKYAEALPIAERAVRAAEQQHGQDHLDVARPLSNLAFLFDNQGRRGDAEPLYKRALAIRDKALGPEHLDVAWSLNSLAGVYRVQSRYAEAEPLYRRSLAILEKARGPDHPDVAFALNGLGSLYHSQGRYHAAEPIYQRVLAIREKALGPDHLDVAWALTNLAGLYRARSRSFRRSGQAEPLYLRALAIREKALGPDHPEVAWALSNLARLYWATSRYGEAEPLFARALSIHEKALGPDHPDVGQSLNNMAVLYVSQGRHADAEPLYVRSLAVKEKARGPDHLDVALTLNNLAWLYQVQGRYSEAAPLYKRALVIREKAFGLDHPSIGTALGNLADLYCAQGRYSEAEPLYKRSLSIGEKAHGPGHQTVALRAGKLGAFLKSEGRLDEAEPLLQRAMETGEKALGQKHPQVVRATIQLAELFGLQGRKAEAEQLFLKAGATMSVDLKEFQIYFATNRKRDLKQKRVAFGNDRSTGELALGTISVIVPQPSTDAEGSDGGEEKVSETRISDLRQLAIQPAELKDTDKLVRAARERLLGARTYLGQALVFVHGYNVSFDNAVRRAGQLAYDLGFDGPVFMFSWPSREKLLSYVGDRESAQLSADSLRMFLETVVAETKAKRIHIIAHSMGNVALNEALQSMEPEALAKLNLGELIHASPDLDADLFQRTYRRLQKRGARSTVYAASSDRALGLSSWLRDRPQLGYIPAGGPKTLVDGADLLDITAVNSDVFSLNHDIYANSPAIIGDLRRLLKDGQPPDARTIELLKTPAAGGVYWRYQVPGSKP